MTICAAVQDSLHLETIHLAADSKGTIGSLITDTNSKWMVSTCSRKLALAHAGSWRVASLLKDNINKLACHHKTPGKAVDFIRSIIVDDEYVFTTPEDPEPQSFSEEFLLASDFGVILIDCQFGWTKLKPGVPAFIGAGRTLSHGAWHVLEEEEIFKKNDGARLNSAVQTAIDLSTFCNGQLVAAPFHTLPRRIKKRKKK